MTADARRVEESDDLGLPVNPEEEELLAQDIGEVGPEPTEPGQPAPGEKLWAGKYKTPEELERDVVEKERVIGRQGDQIGHLSQRLQALEAHLSGQAQQQVPTGPSDEEQLQVWVDNPLEAARQLRQQSIDEARGAARFELQAQERQRQDNDTARKILGEKHPDLAGYEAEVQRASWQVVGNAYREGRSLTFDQVVDEAAGLTRTYLDGLAEKRGKQRRTAAEVREREAGVVGQGARRAAGSGGGNTDDQTSDFVQEHEEARSKHFEE